MERITAAARVAFEDRVRAVILKGSALTDDFIPGYSDLDVHVYVPGKYMMGPRAPRLEACVRFQREVGDLDSDALGISGIQVFFINADRYPDDWTKPLPGTYVLVYGGPVDDDMSTEEYLTRSHANLRAYPGHMARLLDRFADKPNASIRNLVRLAGVFLKGALYSAVTVAKGDPHEPHRGVWQENLDLLEREGVEVGTSRTFFGQVRDWASLSGDPEACRQTFLLAIRAMQAIVRWHAETFPGDVEG